MISRCTFIGHKWTEYYTTHIYHGHDPIVRQCDRCGLLERVTNEALDDLIKRSLDSGVDGITAEGLLTEIEARAVRARESLKPSIKES